MATWRNPVFDRTNEDVISAKTQISEWIAAIQNGETFETYELKGCLNLSDINRIEGNIEYLGDLLTKLGYSVLVDIKVWEAKSIPTQRDINRILENLHRIIEAYFQQEGSPDIPYNMLRYSEINDIEENIFRIMGLIEAMMNSFQRSGAFYSGGMRLLPIRR